MHFSTLLSTAFLALGALSSPTPENKRQDLQPWQVVTLGSFTPSLRPGEYPWATIRFNITDPNTIDLGTDREGQPITVDPSTPGRCTATYYAPSRFPFVTRWPCEPEGRSQGWWYFEVVERAEHSSTNFDLKITRVVEVLRLGSSYKRVFSGTGHFQVGDNLAGTCGGSGVCSWGLKAESRPFAVQQSEVQ